MFATDAGLEVRFDRPAAFDADLHQLSNAELINRNERVRRDHFVFEIVRQNRRGVVARKAENGLGHVVCAEREEIGTLLA